MAITIITQPNEDYKQASWNDINFVVSSTNTAQTGFKIIANVKVNGSTVQTLNLYTYPNTTRSYCNVARIVQNYITDVYQGVKPSPSVAGSQTLPTVQVTFQEYYSGGLQGSVISSNVIDCFRAALTLEEVVSSEVEQYQFDAALAANANFKFLTPFQNTIAKIALVAPASISLSNNILSLQDGQRYFLRFLRDSQALILDLEIELGIYDATGTRTHSDNVTYSSLANTKIFDFAIGTDEIESHSWATGFTLDSDDKYIVIGATDGTYAESYNYVFALDWTLCNAYDNYEVHWLNRYGGFDSWVFDRRSKSQTQVNQVTHKINPFDISSPTPTTSQRYVKPHFTQLADTLEMNTNNLKVWEYDGLKDLLTSPEVYVKVNDVFMSATVLENQTYQNYKSSDGIFNMNLKIKIDNSEQRQW